MTWRSTLANRFCAQEDNSSLIDAKQDVDVVFLDLSNDFDMANRRFLLAKREVLTVSSTICGWRPPWETVL